MTKLIISPDDAHYENVINDVIQNLVAGSKFKSMYVAHFIINGLYVFSEGVGQQNPLDIKGAPCPGWQWVAIAREVNDKLAQYIKASGQAGSVQ